MKQGTGLWYSCCHFKSTNQEHFHSWKQLIFQNISILVFLLYKAMPYEGSSFMHELILLVIMQVLSPLTTLKSYEE